MWLALLSLALLTGQLQAGVVADGAKPAAGGPDRTRLERYLRHYYSWPEQSVNVQVGPFKPSGVSGLLETTVKISAKQGQGEPAEETFLLSNDGRYVVHGKAERIDDDPFRATRDRIDLRNQASFGALIPGVTIVEYGDLQCSYCRMMSNVLRQEVPKAFPREVRIVFKDFPLTQIHPWAMDAAIAGRCILQQDGDAFWAFHDWAYEQQAQITPQNFREKVLGFAGSLGAGSGPKKVDTNKLTSCMNGPEARAEVEHSLKEGEALGVNGTPTLFVNGRRLVGNQPLEALKQVVLAEMEYAQGSDCATCTSAPQATNSKK